VDLSDSARFLDALADMGHNTRDLGHNTGAPPAVGKGKGQGGGVAVDCGAGVGRITLGLLAQRFARVDVVEPVAHLLQQARVALAPARHAGEFYQVGLEAFAAAPATYDCIWIQVEG